MTNNNEYLIIMPTFNEADGISIMLNKLLETVSSTVDILVVDDSSPDGTSDVVANFVADYPNIKLMTKNEDKGFAKAYISGFKYALENGYKYVIQMDADGSHQPKFLPYMMALTGQYNYIIGSRWTTGGSVVNWPFRRLLLSKGGNLYFRIMLGARIKDATGGFKIISTELLKKMNVSTIESQGYSFQIELLLRALDAGADVTEYPIEFIERENGVSKMSKKIIVEAMKYVTLVGLKRVFKGKNEIS